MAWDFSTDAEWAEQLAWVEQFVREECEPVDSGHASPSSRTMPFQIRCAVILLRVADGPTKVHQVTLARQQLKGYEPAPDLFPSEHLLRLRAAARRSSPTAWPTSTVLIVVADHESSSQNP